MLSLLDEPQAEVVGLTRDDGCLRLGSRQVEKFFAGASPQTPKEKREKGKRVKEQ